MGKPSVNGHISVFQQFRNPYFRISISLYFYIRGLLLFLSLALSLITHTDSTTKVR